MYFFYVDESGSRDPQVIGTRRDSSTFAKDHLYVLTAIGLYEWKWRRLEREIANLKLELIYDLRHTHHVSLDLSDCEIKSNWLRVPKEREKCSQFLHLLTKGQRLRLVDT